MKKSVQVIREFKQSDYENFKDWAINKILTQQKKLRQLSGDLGQAYSKIGDLNHQVWEMHNPKDQS